MKLLASQHIDKRKWDQMVASDKHFDFFSLSWVLDVLHPNWEMLCDDSQNYIITIPKASKFGLTYRLQPFFIRSLQFPNGNQVDLNAIVQYIKTSARYIHLNFDSDDHNVFQSFGKFQLLDLSPSLDNVKSNYATNAKRILKKIPSDFVFEKHIEIDEFMAFFKQQKGEELVGFKPVVWLRLSHLLRETNNRGMLSIQSIHSNGLLIAAGAFISFKGTCFFLKGTATPEGKKTGAMYALLDHVISVVHSSHHSLDFVGSNNESIAQFYRKFGAQDKSYGILKENNLPAFLKLLKP